MELGSLEVRAMFFDPGQPLPEQQLVVVRCVLGVDDVHDDYWEVEQGEFYGTAPSLVQAFANFARDKRYASVEAFLRLLHSFTSDR